MPCSMGTNLQPVQSRCASRSSTGSRTPPPSIASARPLVGSTPLVVVKVHSAGQTLSSVLANRRCQRVRLLLADPRDDVRRQLELARQAKIGYKQMVTDQQADGRREGGRERDTGARI